jgi:putative exporter of polyketide antibiotics
VIIWSLVIDLAGALISGLQWLEHLSLYHYMALVPARNSDPWTLAIPTAVAIALSAVGVVIFERRDLQLS